MTNTKFLALAALLTGAISLPLAGAHAEGAKASNSAAMQSFKSLDTDRNGVLSQSEYSAQASADQPSFNEVDQNKDGTLTLSELQAKPHAAPTNRTGGNENPSTNN